MGVWYLGLRVVVLSVPVVLLCSRLQLLVKMLSGRCFHVVVAVVRVLEFSCVVAVSRLLVAQPHADAHRHAAAAQEVARHVDDDDDDQNDASSDDDHRPQAECGLAHCLTPGLHCMARHNTHRLHHCTSLSVVSIFLSRDAVQIA